MPGALAIVLVGYAEALGAAKAAAMQSGGNIGPDQELIAHGPANILSGLERTLAMLVRLRELRRAVPER